MPTKKVEPVATETPRAQVLNEAMAIVHKDRNSSYGNPEDNFKQIAALWQSYLDARANNERGAVMSIQITPADVAIMSMLIKIARLAKTPSHHDSAVDIAGYAACLGDIQVRLRSEN